MSLNLVKNLAEHEIKRLAEVGGKALKRWEKLAAKAEEGIKFLEHVGNVGIGFTIVAGYLKFVDAIWHRKWEEAFKAGVETGADVIDGFAQAPAVQRWLVASRSSSRPRRKG